jgi:hypothetical protein
MKFIVDKFYRTLAGKKVRFNGFRFQFVNPEDAPYLGEKYPKYKYYSNDDYAVWSDGPDKSKYQGAEYIDDFPLHIVGPWEDGSQYWLEE